ncbi:MAG: TIGR03032 family protein [Planctomycetota bacterium]|nr:MAG: TIGR03032 family protein [Planctomycetota bacterium]
MAASSEHPHATANQPASAGAAEQPWVEIYGSRGFPQWLAGQRTSLAFSTYQTGKLFLIGTTPDRTLSIFERTFNRAMGMCGDGEGFWLGTKYQLWRFENALAAGELHQERDRLFIPRVAYTTGDIDLHDVAVEDSGRVVFVATSFSCLGTISPRNSFQPLWHPPFISRLLPEDRCHLNGLALRDGRARYVTAVSQSDVADGWRARRRDGGVVIDVVTNEIVCEGLSMPHSPRWYRDELWVLNSGRGEIGKVNLKRRRFEPLAFCPGYLRGLTFVGDHAVVTLSQPRHDKTFNGLELDDELAKRDATAQCGLQVVDLRSGEISHWVKVEHQVTEIYDVVALPGAIRPMSLGLKTDEIERLLVLDPPGIL